MPQMLVKRKGMDVLQPAPLADLEIERGRADWVWIDLLEPGPSEIAELDEWFGFDQLALEDVAEGSPYPKIDDYKEYLFLQLRGVSTATDRVRTAELDVFMSDEYLVTVHAESMPAVEWLWEHTQTTAALAAGGPDRMLARLTEAAARRWLPIVDAVEDNIEQLEEAAIAGDPRVLGEIHALRRDTILLRKAIGPQREVLRELTREGITHVSARARMRFEDVSDLHYRIVESLDTARSLLGTTLDTYRSTVAEKMTDVMKVLTVFAAILLPLSLMAGIYGMNFANIPELQWRWAYFGLLGVMAATAVGLWLYFARRGFIGGPKLHKLPRAIGGGLIGLVTVTTSPIRMLARLALPDLRRAPDNQTGDGGSDSA